MSDLALVESSGGSCICLRDQQKQIFAVTDLNVSPKWEINFGVGVGSTAATDHLIMKGIVGRRFKLAEAVAGGAKLLCVSRCAEKVLGFVKT